MDNESMETIRYEHDTDWLKAISDGDNVTRVSERTGIPYATVYRRFKSREIPADEVITIARAYGVNPVEALAQCGKVTSGEAMGITPKEALRLSSIQDIAAEIVRRNLAGIDRDAINDPDAINRAWDARTTPPAATPDPCA